LAHILFGKPVSTFSGYALGSIVRDGATPRLLYSNFNAGREQALADTSQIIRKLSCGFGVNILREAAFSGDLHTPCPIDFAQYRFDGE
jgi:hypothetical protein